MPLIRIYFYAAAVFCFGYYIIISAYTRKWNSTFALFWPLAGGVHLAAAFIPWTKGVQAALAGVLLLCWIVFLVLEGLICSAMMRKTRDELTYIIVLGAQVRGTRITRSLIYRLEAALFYLKQHPDSRVIVSGGQGKGEAVTEARAMAAYLEKRGIDGSRICLEEASTSTWENLIFSGKIIQDKTQPAAVVTNDFHLYRALRLGKRAGFTNLHGILAPSSPILKLNYLVREFFALLRTFWTLK